VFRAITYAAQMTRARKDPRAKNDQARREAAALLREAGTHFRAIPTPAPDRVARVLGAHARTSALRLDAIALLLEADAHAEAAIVARSVLELGFSAAHIYHCVAAEQQRRASRFEALEAVQLQEMLERIQRQSPLIPVAKGLEKLRSRRDAVVQLHARIEKSMTTNWTGERGWRGVIEAIASPKVRADLLWLYETPYFHLSMYAHPTPTAVRHVFELPAVEEDLPHMIMVAAAYPTGMAFDLVRAYARLPPVVSSAIEERIARFIRPPAKPRRRR